MSTVAVVMSVHSRKPWQQIHIGGSVRQQGHQSLAESQMQQHRRRSKPVISRFRRQASVSLRQSLSQLVRRHSPIIIVGCKQCPMQMLRIRTVGWIPHFLEQLTSLC